MSDLLTIGDKVVSQTSSYEILKEIGMGGQGAVYKVTDGDRYLALKWYKQTTATPERYEAVEHLIETGVPGEHFIWPEEIVEGQSPDHFGYVMPLIDTAKYEKLSVYFGKPKEIPDLHLVIEICKQLTQSFYELHLRGYCYTDLSFANVFVDFSSGNILICDTDNISIDKVDKLENTWGTVGFMAPEWMRGEKPPSTYTDLYALAVVIFRLLHFQHPLQGRLEFELPIVDEAALRSLYGDNPVFIFDPENTTNRPVEGRKDIGVFFWSLYPNWFKDLFVDSFTKGLCAPEMRVRESVWQKKLTRLQARLFNCVQCDGQLFYEPGVMTPASICPYCGQEIGVIPPRLKVDHQVLILIPGRVIYKNQIVDDFDLFSDESVGVVQQKPDSPEIWGIRNTSKSNWYAMVGDEFIREVKPGDIVPLMHHMKLNFGDVTGQIRLAASYKKEA
ncbi:serine/threonine protein kinase [Fusibacter tunisiensis]|uniref:Serine/threonine protein kinase n=1 Tax=Fusibacter tunisiensis TaxID=1008308 RepID=A0ABS2MSA8_9FIRM|nr:serine/threonine-protein kinase [Fusibacter tunisiensis]MBM7562242.1 serine/threonine protein kinase [Fusibacter tunisiensis]